MKTGDGGVEQGLVGAWAMGKAVTVFRTQGDFLNLSLLYFLLGVSFYDKGLSHCCDGAGHGSRQRVPNIVICPFSPMAGWFIGVVFGL